MFAGPFVATAEPVRIDGARPIRVAHLIHTMAHGGVETALLNWVTTSDPSRFDIKIVCFRNPGSTEAAFLRSASSLGLKPQLIDWSRRKPILKAARQLAAVLREHRIEVLHCHNTYANLVGLVASKLYPVKTVTTMYVWGDLGFVRNVLQSIDKYIMKYFDKVSAHCEEAKRGTVERGIPESEIPVLICGYPRHSVNLTVEDRSALRQELGAGPSQTALLYLARFWPEKAHDNLLDAIEILRREKADVILWLPGDGPDLPRIKELTAAKGLDHCVRFLGFRSDFERLLVACDIQVHPSDAEGVSLAICAGMAAGVPIVASRVGGLEEVLRDGHSAILLPPRTPRLLADAIHDLIRNPDKARMVGSNARRFIEEEYSIKAATSRVESVYESLVHR